MIGEKSNGVAISTLEELLPNVVPGFAVEFSTLKDPGRAFEFAVDLGEVFLAKLEGEGVVENHTKVLVFLHDREVGDSFFFPTSGPFICTYSHDS